MKKIKELIKKYWDFIAYMLFGALTTIANYLVYLPCYNWLEMSATVSNIIAWVAAVAVAFLTNKPWVFKSHDWSRKVVVPELTKFVSCRLGSLLLESAAIFAFVDLMGFDGNVFKLITSIFVVIINYIGSKLLVFRK